MTGNYEVQEQLENSKITIIYLPV